MNKTIEQVELEANKKIPREVVSLRDGGGGKKLSYLESHYVIARMNEVFGVLGWDSETVEMRQVNKDDAKPAYVAKVRITALVKTEDGGYMKATREGFGFGSDKSSLNPHEMAVKEAESDAFKRAARQFGMSLGLALYDKSQENVEDAILTPASSTDRAPAPRDASAVPTPSRETLNKQINATAKVIAAKGIKTLDEIKQLIKDKHKAEKVADLSDASAQQLLTELKGLL